MSSYLGCHFCGETIRPGTGLDVGLSGPPVGPPVEIGFCPGCAPLILKRLRLPPRWAAPPEARGDSPDSPEEDVRVGDGRVVRPTQAKNKGKPGPGAG